MASMKEFRTSALRELVQNLQRALDLSKTALNSRDKVIYEYSGYNSLEIARDLSKQDPEEYYHFKHLDKAISIVYDLYHFNYSSKKRCRSSTWYYHIKLYGFNLKEINDFMEYSKHSSSSIVLSSSENFDVDYIGDFSDLTTAIEYFNRVLWIYLNWKGYSTKLEF